ncbi:AglZ/HisF2 family acetamidino modification protein [Algoriphagus jejuensis]|uniref:imidazole glycerol-phosphate synthase n=1 Tax=Algoriphagus jejuensis TaxID=419934 RepID=A0ABP3YJA3_9BACT
MLRTRVIPVLLLKDSVLVKTINFKKPKYIGDPINTCRIFNELEVDELSFLDITASLENRKPNFEMLERISTECFMPLSYGGGISTVQEVEKILKIGFEKVIINTSSLVKPELITQIAKVFGSQAIVVAVDVKKNFFGKYQVFGTHGKIRFNYDPIAWARTIEDLGAGEILLTNIEHEGTWKGLDVDLIKKVSDECSIPIIAHGGAGSIGDITQAVHKGGASAVALGSMVVYQQKGMGVLINFPDRVKLESALN